MQDLRRDGVVRQGVAAATDIHDRHAVNKALMKALRSGLMRRWTNGSVHRHRPGRGAARIMARRQSADSAIAAISPVLTERETVADDEADADDRPGTRPGDDPDRTGRWTASTTVAPLPMRWTRSTASARRCSRARDPADLRCVDLRPASTPPDLDARRRAVRRGFAGTTTREIAAAVGTTETVLFRHFPDQAELYAAILEHRARPMPISAWLICARSPTRATTCTVSRRRHGHSRLVDRRCRSTTG